MKTIVRLGFTIWTIRHGGIAGLKQDRAYEKLGPVLFERRIQRVRRWIDM